MRPKGSPPDIEQQVELAADLMSMEAAEIRPHVVKAATKPQTSNRVFVPARSGMQRAVVIETTGRSRSQAVVGSRRAHSRPKGHAEAFGPGRTAEDAPAHVRRGRKASRLCPYNLEGWRPPARRHRRSRRASAVRGRGFDPVRQRGGAALAARCRTEASSSKARHISVRFRRSSIRSGRRSCVRRKASARRQAAMRA